MKTRRLPLPLESTAQLDALYATLPAIPCKKKCQNVCGLIEMSSLEYQRIINRTGRTMEYHAGLTCPCLNIRTGLCKVHDIRPMLCRLWGLVRKMACPYGCEPERWLTDYQASLYFRRVQEISEKAKIPIASGFRLV